MQQLLPDFPFDIFSRLLEFVHELLEHAQVLTRLRMAELPGSIASAQEFLGFGIALTAAFGIPLLPQCQQGVSLSLETSRSKSLLTRNGWLIRSCTVVKRSPPVSLVSLGKCCYRQNRSKHEFAIDTAARS